MKRLLLLPLILALQAAYSAPRLAEDGEPMRRTLRVTVDNIREARGTLWVGVYESPEDFLDREKARLEYVKVKMEGSNTLEIPGLQVGREYALGLFHDVNDNGEFDLNWLGLPAEPWAFSGEPRTRLRLPRFEEVSFRLTDRAAAQVLRLRKW